MKYRIIEMRPGVWGIETNGLLWGWNPVLNIAEFPIEFSSELAAVEKAKELFS